MSQWDFASCLLLYSFIFVPELGHFASLNNINIFILDLGLNKILRSMLQLLVCFGFLCFFFTLFAFVCIELKVSALHFIFIWKVWDLNFDTMVLQHWIQQDRKVVYLFMVDVNIITMVFCFCLLLYIHFPNLLWISEKHSVFLIISCSTLANDLACLFFLIFIQWFWLYLPLMLTGMIEVCKESLKASTLMCAWMLFILK